MDEDQDTMVNILSRLPLKSIIQCKSVSKSWGSTISGAKLAAAHLQRTKVNSSASQRRQFLIPGGTLDNLCGRYLIEIENGKLHSSSFLQIPDEIAPHHYELCYSDGLIVAAGKGLLNTNFVVWNPSTRTCIKFRCPYRFRRWHPIMPVHGFCYDSSSDSYKFVITDMKQYAVFHCTNWEWSELKEVDELGFDIKLDATSQGVSCNGNFYWIFSNNKRLKGVRTYEKPPLYYEMICFDSREEKFSKLPVPKSQSSNISKVGFVWGGSNLCLRHRVKTEMVRDAEDQLWTLRRDGGTGEYSWLELWNGGEISKALSGNMRTIDKWRIVCVVSKNKVVVSGVRRYYHEKSCYYIFNKRKERFNKICEHLSELQGRLDFVPFMENMFFSGEDNGGRGGVCHY